MARGIEFAARVALETGADCAGWADLLARLSPPCAHGSWRRQALLAAVRSEAGFELLGKCSAALLAENAALLIELITTIVAVETVATADLMTMPDGTKVDLPRSFRTNLTGSAILVLRWVLAHDAEIPIAAIGPVADLVQVQLYFLKHVRPLAEQTAALLFGWLRQLDVRDATVTILGERSLFRSVTEARRAAVDKLRLIALILGEFVADDPESLFDRDQR